MTIFAAHPRAKMVSDLIPRRDGSTCSGVRTQLTYASNHIAKRAMFLGLSDDYADKAIDRAEKTASRIVDLCESPIERIILPWLLVEDYGPKFHTFPAEGFNHMTDDFVPPGDIVIAPQFAFVRYRADFAVLARLNGRQKIVVVECDGDEYHFASKDNRRDACLRTWGIDTVRGSGSEINHCPRNLTARVSSIIQEWASNELDA